MKQLLFLFLLITALTRPFDFAAQCTIGDPSTDAPNWNTSLSIEENYNEARRWEESNRGLTANCLGNMSAPPGGWAGRTDDEIALWIHNAERTCRSLLPFHGVETNLDNVSQTHGDWLLSNDVFSHGGNATYGTGSSYTTCPLPGVSIPGSSISQRINGNVVLNNCWQLVSQNLFVQAASNMNNAVFDDFVAKGIYSLLYQDANVGWGHRHNMFQVYNNNNGPSSDEGFIGVGVSFGSGYEPVQFGCTGNWWGKILTIDYYDPLSSCSGFSFNALPVEWLGIDVRAEGTGALLTWRTASEHQSACFWVERASRDAAFVPIGKVDAAGQSTVVQSYSFFDPSPFSGNNYYRLMQVDIDNTSQFSPVVALYVGHRDQWHTYPNPFRDQLVVQTREKNSLPLPVRITNAAGHVVYDGFLDPQADTLHMVHTAHWPSGTYVVRLADEEVLLIKN